jgi:hypothetical protein
MERRQTDPEVLREIPYVGDPKRSRVALQQAADGFVPAEPLTRQPTPAFGILSSTWSPAHAAFCAPRLLAPFDLVGRGRELAPVGISETPGHSPSR